jgi:hypothetical protein
VADDVAELAARLDEAIREEVSHYPGEDDDSDRCTDDEEPCMAAHVHHAWSSGDELTVYASVGALARLCASALQDAGWQRARGLVEAAEALVAYWRAPMAFQDPNVAAERLDALTADLAAAVDALTQPEDGGNADGG